MPTLASAVRPVAMGCGGSKNAYAVDDTAEDESRAITAHLESMQREEQAVTKMLVLGTGESGKSTGECNTSFVALLRVQFNASRVQYSAD